MMKNKTIAVMMMLGCALLAVAQDAPKERSFFLGLKAGDAGFGGIGKEGATEVGGYAGYQFHPKFGIELGIDSIEGREYAHHYRSVETNMTLIQAMLYGRIPYQRWAFTGKLGVVRADIDYVSTDYFNPKPVVTTGTVSNSKLALGAGAQFAILPKVLATIDVTTASDLYNGKGEVPIDSKDVFLTQVGLRFHF